MVTSAHEKFSAGFHAIGGLFPTPVPSDTFSYVAYVFKIGFLTGNKSCAGIYPDDVTVIMGTEIQ